LLKHTKIDTNRFIPESIRWLNVNGKGDEAMKVLRRIAMFNNKEIPSEITLKSPIKEGNSPGSYLDLFRPLRMAKQALVQFYAWYTDSVLFLIFCQLLYAVSSFRKVFFID